MTPRDQLLALLADHEPADEAERADLLRMRAYARTLPAPWSRDQAEAHFTGSALLVDRSGTRVCLLHHARLDRWLQPGGHAEPEDGGSLERTARREAAEETGCRVELHSTAPRPLDVDIHAVPGRAGVAAHLHLDVRFLLVAADADALRHRPEEHHAAAWFSFAEADRRADEPELRRLLAKGRRVGSGRPDAT